MLKPVLVTAVAAAVMASASGASAQQATSVTGNVGIEGSVAARCTAGTLVGGDSVFDLGVLIDTATGFLRPDLSAPPKVLTAAYCNSQSVITIVATPMVAQSFSGPAPTGFTDSVDFVATASGWTPTPAAFDTSQNANPGAIQARNQPWGGDITVSLSGFTAHGGATLKPVADPQYQGTIVVSLSVAD